MSERALEQQSVDALVDRSAAAMDADERHYLFFHTIVFEADDWQVEPPVAERAA